MSNKVIELDLGGKLLQPLVWKVAEGMYNIFIWWMQNDIVILKDLRDWKMMLSNAFISMQVSVLVLIDMHVVLMS